MLTDESNDQRNRIWATTSRGGITDNHTVLTRQKIANQNGVRRSIRDNGIRWSDQLISVGRNTVENLDVGYAISYEFSRSRSKLESNDENMYALYQVANILFHGAPSYQ